MYLPSELRCPNDLTQFVSSNEKPVEEMEFLDCPAGCRFPVVNGIPRFVGSENYASAFGLQWNAFRQTQLDSYTKMGIFRERLTRCLGGSLEVVRGKSVLEVGCGAGSFTEVLLSAGARVFACDLSEAVEANYANFKGQPNYFVCQANVLHLPVEPLSFDVVLCLGVIQHTPDPEATIAALSKCLKPGGMLVIDHYSYNYPYTLPRKIVRELLIKLPAGAAMKTALFLAQSLLRVHKIFWSERPVVRRLHGYLLRISPLVDHYHDYPQLGRKLVGEWSVLNTHDMLTDYYKHFRSAEEIENCLSSCDLTDIETHYGGNGVEARARRPVAVEQREQVKRA